MDGPSPVVPKKVMELSAQEGAIKSVYAALNGVHRMSPEIEGLVETSPALTKSYTHPQ